MKKSHLAGVALGMLCVACSHSRQSAQPSAALMMRPQKVRRASFTFGSLAAIMELMAQMGLRPAASRRSSQRIAVAMKMFRAK